MSRILQWTALAAFLALASGCSDSGKVSPGSDSGPTDQVGADGTLDALPDGHEKDVSDDDSPLPDGVTPDLGNDAGDVVEPDADVVVPPTPGPMPWTGLVTSGGVAQSDTVKLLWRIWEELPASRASNSTVNFYGGLVVLP